jgi:hypothetical protein
MAWDDEPPTEAELKRVSTPRWDDEPPPPDVSEIESGIRGTAQGLSFGLADEATGAAEAAKDWLMNDPKGFMDNYKKHRDESRKNYKSAEEANPGTYMAGQFAGGAGTALLSGGTGLGALAAQGALQGFGSSDADLTEGNYKGAIGDTVIGGSLGAAGEAVGRLGGKALGYAANKTGLSNAPSWIADKLGQTAENLAVKATGATGNQANKFAPNAGRELLDRGIVRFGRTAEDVAERAAGASKEAGQAIGSALKDLDARGVKASDENVKAAIEGKIKELAEVPGNDTIIRQLNRELDNLYERGASELPVSIGEKAKRAYQGQTNYASPEAEKKASAQLASAFKEEVESAAMKADPSIANKFIEDKKVYGLLKPIQEAAEKRASQLNQSPFGGFGDFAAGAAGSIGGGPGVAATVGARRILAPRLASSGAIIADNLADVVAKTPQALGKFAKPLAAAAARGGNALAANHFVLLQTNPEYRDLVMKAEEDSKMAQQIRYRVPTKE